MKEGEKNLKPDDYAKYIAQIDKLNQYCKSNQSILDALINLNIDKTSKYHMLDLFHMEISRIINFIEKIKTQREKS